MDELNREPLLMNDEIKCPACHGQGRFWPGDVTWVVPWRPYPVDCPLCKGSGAIHKDLNMDVHGEICRVADCTWPPLTAENATVEGIAIVSADDDVELEI